MLSKILVGITALVLIGVAGLRYYDDTHCRSGSGSCKNNITQSVTPPCCQPPAEITTSSSSEDLTIMPREVVEQ